MPRKEFTAQTQRDAWERAGGVCEAAGEMYGLPAGVRCTWDLKRGVNYDHDDPDANSKDNSLENCVCLCPPCHLHKTRHRDRPLIAKTNHQQDKARGIRQPGSRPMPGGRNGPLKRKFNGQVVSR
jgi:hypothetical protein